MTRMAGRALRREARDGVVDRPVHACDGRLRPCRKSLEVLVVLAHHAGRQRRAGQCRLSQTILLNTFPRRQHRVRARPVRHGGRGSRRWFGADPRRVYLAEAYSWRWAFYMLVPVGVAAVIGMQLTLRADGPPAHGALRLDRLPRAVGRARRAATRGSRAGVRLDWFDSTEIIVECLVAAGRVLCVPFPLPDDVGAVPQSAPAHPTATTPSALVLVTIYGMLNFTPMVLVAAAVASSTSDFSDALVGQGDRRGAAASA